MRFAKVPILPEDECKRMFQDSTLKPSEGKDAQFFCELQKISSSLFSTGTMCAGFEQGGVDSCNGDSGGPLACKVDGESHFWDCKCLNRQITELVCSRSPTFYYLVNLAVSLRFWDVKPMAPTLIFMNCCTNYPQWVMETKTYLWAASYPDKCSTLFIPTGIV